MNDQSLTPEEVASALNITKQTVYEMVKRGELNCYRIGRKIRIDERELNAYKEKKQQKDVIIDKNENSISTFIISGQDIILDILIRYLETLNPDIRFLRSHKGSYNGLYDLYNDRVNVASAHLWDGFSNSYNHSYVKSMLPGVSVKIINLVKRYQGFYVKQGNPKNILGWNDFTRSDIKFVNREKGSGTRVLLDEHLRLLKLKPSYVNGYNNIASSHTLVATSIAREYADFGIGNEKAVRQIPGLEFIPLQQENYDLVIKEDDLDTPVVSSLLNIIKSNEFKDEILSLGGYCFL